ncbi:hypothetical protein GCM10008090_20200 [Arenicella chitinivorans]|uniref:Peptidase M1 membrane alanine aminopeptidase domain-containing protein n=2 Tax=Arenicella chitinivorans TaxID=1329800 RepID=A0A918RU47_9GAMM|nr:hypothetical protein GCM10008090_20200 [Arenicella chitinivorans]
MWYAHYVAGSPVKRLYFHRNPNNARQQRWQPLSNEIEIEIEDDNEVVRHRTGKLFSSASFRLTPTYIPLPKDYAPFSPFSNGDVAIYSGRFFACSVAPCDMTSNHYPIRLTAPKNEHIVIQGKIHASDIEWVGRNSGEQIYVGRIQPKMMSGLLAIIDPALPSSILSSLTVDLPILMQFMQTNLGELQNQYAPTLFASFAREFANPNTKSTQGGTLTDQIFTHWDLNQAQMDEHERTFDQNSTLWFLAHEAGHFYQRSHAKPNDHNDAWIHEGMAEMLAYQALQQHYTDEAQDFLHQKVLDATNACHASLTETSLVNASEQQKFSTHYDCGLLIHLAVEQHAERATNSSAIKVWNNYVTMTAQGAEANTQTYLEAIAQNTSAEFAQVVFAFIQQTHPDPKAAVKTLFAAKLN